MDKDLNNSTAKVHRSGRWIEVCWSEVVVGDIIKTDQDKPFCADIVLLQSANSNGICNIETANLDGETNLKIKKGRSTTYSIECSESGLDYAEKIHAVLESDPPSESMESSGWKGNLYVKNVSDPCALNMEQLLLRGCVLRNTKWIIGIVAFTGRETKLMLNNKATIFKRSSVEQAIDTALNIVFGFMGFFCVFGVCVC